MLYTDLRELKAVLEIKPNNTREDKKLSFFVTQASQWIEELLDRPGLSFAQRTEFYKGTGTQKLLLKSRPVVLQTTQANQGINILFDEGGFFGSASGAFTNANSQYTYGTEFCLDLDQSDGVTSRCGILIRIDDLWHKPQNRQMGYLSPFIGEDFGSYKITYSGGYTVDTLPAAFRMAADLMIARMRFVFPLGLELGSDSFQEKSLSILAREKDYLISMVKPILWPYRNWTF